MAGLSILIPVFNREVAHVVHALSAQAPAWPGPVEIRLLDDGSAEEVRVQNRPLGALPGVVYQELATNVGRAAIRNRLVASAKYEWVLLLDNTSQVPSSYYLARYAAALGQAPVVVGGVCYAIQAPAAPAQRLRWLYGRQREARSLAQRRATPFNQLLVNNLLAQKAVLQAFPLDECLRGYGHEDTKLGWQLAAAGLSVQHLDNPIVHAGLDTATAFLEKSEQAVRNLAHLLREGNLGAGAGSQLARVAQRLQRAGLAAGARAVLALGEPLLRRNLLSNRPSLRALDALKLLWLLRQQPGR